MTGDDPTITIPVVSVTQADGNAIKAQLAAAAAVSMRVARNESVRRDGAIDTLVVAHEWGHYISYRLIGDSNGLDANQAGGLGEGWSDFHQMLLLVKEADRNLPNNANFGGTYASNTYLLGGPDFAPDAVNNAYYYGDRRYPYTRDLAKNPLTLRAHQRQRAAARRPAAVRGSTRGPIIPKCTTPARSGARCCGSATATCSTTRRGSRSRRRRTG